MSALKRILEFMILATILSSCGVDGISVLSGKKDKTKDENEATGNLAEGQFAAGSDAEQSLSAPSGTEIDGAAINFPVGSLELDTLVTIGTGASIANESIAAELGISDANVSQAGPAVVFNSSTDLNASEDNPFQLQLPLTNGAGLNLAACANLVVIYHQKRLIKEENKVQNYYGAFNKSQIEIVPGIIKVKTRYFGSYQPACTEKEITAEITPVKTTTPIVQKIAELPYVGLWESECMVRDDHDDKSGEVQDSANENTEVTSQDEDDPAQVAIEGFLNSSDPKASAIASAINFTQSEFERINNESTANGTTKWQKSEKTFFTLTRNTFNYRSIEYFGTNCKIPSISSVVTGDVQFTGKNENFEDTQNIDVTFKTSTIKTLSKLDVFIFRYIDICGKSDWSPEVPVNISTAECPQIMHGDDGNEPGRQFESIVQIQGDKMRLGTKDKDNSSERDDSIRDDKLEEKFMTRVK